MHLILMRGEAVADRAAPFDHEVFTVREPGGSVVTFFSSHASGKPVSLTLLWALEGALMGEHWQVVARRERTRLLLALEDYEEPG
jgi:hypothetical protein